MLKEKLNILVLGATGMLGHAIFKHFSAACNYNVYGTVRTKHSKLVKFFNSEEMNNLIDGINAENFDSFIRAFEISNPDVVINCIGIIKHLPESTDRYKSININSFLPHHLAKLCAVANARFLQISTDCVFDGKKGNYKEFDNANAEDLYGKTKYLGEVDYPNAITLRTSIIGHELNSNVSLVDWFLTQHDRVNGYVNAIYTGFPTYEIANIVEKFVIPNPQLHGLYHLSSEPINKYDLLALIAEIYKKDISINKSDEFVLDRSLNSDIFREKLSFMPKSWVELVKLMHQKFVTYDCYQHKHMRVRYKI